MEKNIQKQLDLMIENIQKQLFLIEESGMWIKRWLKEDNKQIVHRKLVNCRWKLNRKKFALESNPAAATYGESQAGKSYLVSALLSTPGKPFKVLDGNGMEFDFKDEINPRGNDMESTSVVTRFSTKYKQNHSGYPIIAKLLSPTDIILVICEAYYNNLRVNSSLSFDSLKEKIESFENKYANKPECQKLIIEDDILDIEKYFNDNFSNLVYKNIKDAHFFEKTAALAARVSPDEWKDVFSLLWNFNTQLTKLFDDLIMQYKTLDFTDTVYLPIDAVLRNKGTLLDVRRLDEIYAKFDGPETEYSGTSPVFYNKNGNGKEVNFLKPYLCALTAELIFVLPETIKDEKPFLAQTDLLDFPGTRRFETIDDDKINNSSLTVLLRRGRVDYLFNKYSSYGIINTLLFCQNHRQSNQSVIPKKLDRWIGNMMGKTMEEREKFGSPISPLFVISTWFNKDLEFDFNQDKPDNNPSLNARWHQRFDETLKKDIFGADTYLWLTGWTTSNPNFQNIYLLRDYYQSSDEKSKIYNGYNQERRESVEIKPAGYPAFREDLRKSFIKHLFVKQHFANPEKSWDEAASINKDGTELIIANLTIAADNINEARRKKMIDELDDISKAILYELQKHYHNSDKGLELQKAKSRAGDIQQKLDLAFMAEGMRLFGYMMKEFMIDEGSVLRLYTEKINDIESRNLVNQNKYNTVRDRVTKLNPKESFETNLEYLYEAYEKTTDEEKKNLLASLEAGGVDVKELIAGKTGRIQNLSHRLAEALIKHWLEIHLKHCFEAQDDKRIIKTILQDFVPDILGMFENLFQKLELQEKIAKKISSYIDGLNRHESACEMCADISAAILNKCIDSVGMEYITEKDLEALKQANEENKLRLVLDHDELYTNEDVAKLFEEIDNLPQLSRTDSDAGKSLPNRHNYTLWSNRLKIGFVYVCDIPKYDVQANKTLGDIIEECKTIKYI